MTVRTQAISAGTPSLFGGLIDSAVNEPVRSPLNYIGGKYKLLPQLLRCFPQEVDTFVDLFCGGCNVGVNAPARRVLFNDNLVYLTDLYRALKECGPEMADRHVRERIARFELSLTNADGYRQLRALYNTERNPLDLFVLAAYSFNHQIRFNNAHEFNNPFGRERSSFNPSMRHNLARFVARIQSMDCEFSGLDFRNVDLSGLGAADFVYCDPPYLITTGTYNDGRRGFTGWSEAEELCLLDLLDGLSSRGVRFALSNVLRHKGRENHLLREWASRHGYEVTHLSKHYANSSYHTKNRERDASDEVLITNYPT